jgi:hypothetical protein
LPNPPIVIVQYPLKKPRMIFWRWAVFCSIHYNCQLIHRRDNPN